MLFLRACSKSRMSSFSITWPKEFPISFEGSFINLLLFSRAQNTPETNIIKLGSLQNQVN